MPDTPTTPEALAAAYDCQVAGEPRPERRRHKRPEQRDELAEQLFNGFENVIANVGKRDAYWHGYVSAMRGHLADMLRTLSAERDTLRARVAELEAEADDLRAELDTARDAPWPKWADETLAVVREFSGYDGFDDADTGVDLPAETRDCLSELAAAADRHRSRVAALEAERAELRPLRDDLPPMGEGWSVTVESWGDPVLTISDAALSGRSDLSEHDEALIVGCASHLLSFVGYGLPPTTFNPDEAERAAVVPAGWLPIETAPENMTTPAAVRWIDSDGHEQHDLDQTEDGCWVGWHDHAEHVEVIGGHGVSYTPPYTHWMPLPAAPTPTGDAT
jgi:hypothetical protein